MTCSFFSFFLTPSYRFVASPIYPELRSGHYTDALTSKAVDWGLAADNSSRVRGVGDQKILDAMDVLFALKRQGTVKAVGITGELISKLSSSTIPLRHHCFHKGYSLPALLRLSILINQHYPRETLDIVLSFCHLTLQNSSLVDFLPAFHDKGHVGTLISASPLSMGLLTQSPPTWHPAPEPMLQATRQAVNICQPYGGLPNIALGFGFRSSTLKKAAYRMPVIVGFSNLDEVQEGVQVFHRVIHESDRENDMRSTVEEDVRKLYVDADCLDWSWPCPPIEI